MTFASISRTNMLPGATDDVAVHRTIRATLALVVSLVALLAIQVSSASAGFAPAVNYPAGDSPRSIASGDLNADGKLDLVAANAGSNNISILIGQGEGKFKPGLLLPTGSYPRSVAIADLNNDSKPDVAVANADSNTISILTGKGNAAFNAKVDFPAGNNPYAVAIADLNSDTKPDLAVANIDSDTISILTGKGDGTFNAKVVYAAGLFPGSIAIADLNSDDKADLAVTNFGSNSISVLTGKGDGTFNAKIDYPTGVGPVSVAMDDLNSDNKADLAVANFNSKSISILTGKGDGTFNAKVDYPFGSGPRSVVIADLDNDNKPDLAVADFDDGTVSILTGKGNATFNAEVDYPSGGGAWSIAIADLNNDTKPDLAVANIDSNNISVLINQAPTAMITPAAQDFGDQQEETSSQASSFTVTNQSGGDPLKVSSIAVSGPQAAEFKVVSETCSQAELKLGQSCEVRATFSPSSAGSKQATLEISSNNFTGTLKAELTGIGRPSPVAPITNPTTTTATFDGKNLSVRLKCPARFKPSCITKAVPVTLKSRKGKPMASSKKTKIKSNRWKTTTFVIKPAFRNKVKAMTKFDKKLLFTRQLVRSKRINGKPNRKASTVFHVYKVRAKG